MPRLLANKVRDNVRPSVAGGRDTLWSYECQRVKWESSAVVIEMGE